MVMYVFDYNSQSSRNCVYRDMSVIQYI